MYKEYYHKKGQWDLQASQRVILTRRTPPTQQENPPEWAVFGASEELGAGFRGFLSLLQD